MKQPCPGFASYQTNSDGTVTIEKLGLRTYGPDAPERQWLVQTWQNFGGQLTKAAQRYGVPVPWMAAIAAVETGLWSKDPQRQATITNDEGAVGLMQVMPTRVNGELKGSPKAGTKEQLLNLDYNIDRGALFLKEWSDRFGPEFPVVAAAYNAGRKECKGAGTFGLVSDKDYPARAVTFLNTAILDLGIGRSFPWQWFALGLAGGAAAGYYLRARASR